MSKGATQSADTDHPAKGPITLDSTHVQMIVREVLKRLNGLDVKQGNEKSEAQHSITDRVITTHTLENLGSNVRVSLRQDAIVTAAAKDLARDRNIEFEHGGVASHAVAKTLPGDDAAKQLRDQDDPDRGRVVVEQLRRRGVNQLNHRILLSEKPAMEVIQEIRNGQTAVMINSLNQIQRFARECHPSTWVLDMKQLNLTAAINVIVQISKLETSD